MDKQYRPKLSNDVGGFRSAWLILLEAATFSSMALIWAKLGFWYSAVLFVPFFSIVIGVTKYEYRIKYYWLEVQYQIAIRLEKYITVAGPFLSAIKSNVQKSRENIVLPKKPALGLHSRRSAASVQTR